MREQHAATTSRHSVDTPCPCTATVLHDDAIVTRLDHYHPLFYICTTTVTGIYIDGAFKGAPVTSSHVPTRPLAAFLEYEQNNRQQPRDREIPPLKTILHNLVAVDNRIADPPDSMGDGRNCPVLLFFLFS